MYSSYISYFGEGNKLEDRLFIYMEFEFEMRGVGGKGALFPIADAVINRATTCIADGLVLGVDDGADGRKSGGGRLLDRNGTTDAVGHGFWNGRV